MDSKQSNYQLDYLQKTINLKDEQIKELLEELKQTQELHQSLKKKYINEEQTLKEKTKKLEQLLRDLKK